MKQTITFTPGVLLDQPHVYMAVREVLAGIQYDLQVEFKAAEPNKVYLVQEWSMEWAPWCFSWWAKAVTSLVHKGYRKWIPHWLCELANATVWTRATVPKTLPTNLQELLSFLYLRNVKAGYKTTHFLVGLEQAKEMQTLQKACVYTPTMPSVVEQGPSIYYMGIPVIVDPMLPPNLALAIRSLE